MSLWGNSTSAESRPKFLPVDSNAKGSTGAREHVIATTGGWGLSPGLAASGNDNADAQPEILVCIRNLAKARGSATISSIDWTQAAYADAATFDITLTFDEAIDVTSAAWSGNQTVTNKAYILLSRLGATDLVEDNTIACMYYSGDGTNQIVFRGTLQAAGAGYIGFDGSGVGDTQTAGESGIKFNGTSAMAEEDGTDLRVFRQEGGTVSSPADQIVLNGTNGSSANAGDGILAEDIGFTLAGVDGATNIMTTIPFTGGDSEVSLLMDSHGQSEDTGEDHLILNGTDGSSTNANDNIVMEAYTSDIAVYSQAGSSTGSAYVLNGVTTT